MPRTQARRSPIRRRKGLDYRLTGGAAGLVLNLDPHEEKGKLAEDHDNGGCEDHQREFLAVPPEDSNQVRHDQDEGDVGGETISRIRLHHGHGL